MNENRLNSGAARERLYKTLCVIAVAVIAFLFAFPLYWIITGAFKTGKEINSTTPVWVPSEWDIGNFERLMSKRTAPLFDITIPALSIRFGKYIIKLGKTVVITGPTVPAAIRWLINTVFMSVSSMLLTSGGPENSTMTIMYYIYYNAFKLYKYGYGNAMGVILAIIIAILSAIQFKLGQEK